MQKGAVARFSSKCGVLREGFGTFLWKWFLPPFPRRVYNEIVRQTLYQKREEVQP